MSILFNYVFLAAALSHLMVDTLNGQRSVVFTYLSTPLGLSNAQLGFYSTLYILVPSLFQPVFGWITDKIGPRWMITGGVLWMGAFYAAGIMTPGLAGLALIAVAAIGSGVFHPAGTMLATQVGRQRFKGREASAASFFFLFGQMGFFFGPLASGLILDNLGFSSLLWVTVLVIPMAVFDIYALRGTGPKEIAPAQEKEAEAEERPKLVLWALVVFALVAALQSWATQNLTTYLPKFLSDLGATPAQYGTLAAVMTVGGAVGTVMGGNLADRFGKRKIVAIALGMAVLPIAVISLIGWSPWLFLVAPLAGAFTGATHSVIVVLAQRLIPSGVGFASGLILGFMFAAGSLGAFLSGYLADLWGFPVVFAITAGLVLLAAGLARSLRRVALEG